MSNTGKLWSEVKRIAKTVNYPPVQVGQIISLEPFVISFQGLEISKENGDTIYINHLMLDSNIELDLASMDNPQTINPALWQADNSPTSSVEISGTQKQFVTDLYNWLKSIHARYILNVGDFITLQKLKNNTYLVLEKVQKIEQ
jgi:hypothetical protein